MVKHESHPLAAAGQVTDAVLKGGYQVIQALVQHVGQHGAFDMAPQAFNQESPRHESNPTAKLNSIHGFT